MVQDLDEFEGGLDIDLERLVSSLTPRADNEKVKSYQNTVAVACPVCEDPFDDLVVCKGAATELVQSEPLDICVAVVEGRPLIFTHKA
jgi:uncharacterized ParB-like nuclease family protein